MNTSDWINLMVAIGTIGASITSLWLGLIALSRRFDAMLVLNASTHFQPILRVQNSCNKVVSIKSVEIIIDGVRICCVDTADNFNLSKCSVLCAGQSSQIDLRNSDMDFSRIEKSDKHSLKVIVMQINGPRCIFRTEISHSELEECWLSQGWYDDLPLI